MDKSKFLEGLIETVLIPGKLEEFITQVTPINPNEIGTIYGDEKLTGLLKDIITEKDVPAKITKARILLDAAKASSVLYSDITNYTGVAGVGKDMPNPVNTENIETKVNYIKDNIKDLPDEHKKYVNAMTSSIKVLNKTGINPAMFSEQQLAYLDGLFDALSSKDTNFASGPGIQVPDGPAYSSVPASVQPTSEHVSVFAENINEGDIYNGRKVVAVTEEISPVDKQILYSIELDDRTILKAAAGTEVTFSALDYIVNNAGDNNMNN